MKKIQWLTTMIVTSIPAAVWASNPTPVSSANGGYIAQVFFGLFLVLIMIFAAAWLFKRIGPGSFANNQQMRIVSSLSLGTREKLVIVEVGEQQLLLGLTAQSINTLHVIEEPLVTKSPNKPMTQNGEQKSYTEISEFSRKIKEIMSKGKVA